MGVYWVRPPIRMNVVGENPGRATDRRKATAFPKVGDLGFSGFPSDFTSLIGTIKTSVRQWAISYLPDMTWADG